MVLQLAILAAIIGGSAWLAYWQIFRKGTVRGVPRYRADRLRRSRRITGAVLLFLGYSIFGVFLYGIVGMPDWAIAPGRICSPSTEFADGVNCGDAAPLLFEYLAPILPIVALPLLVGGLSMAKPSAVFDEGKDKMGMLKLRPSERRLRVRAALDALAQRFEPVIVVAVVLAVYLIGVGLTAMVTMHPLPNCTTDGRCGPPGSSILDPSSGWQWLIVWAVPALLIGFFGLRFRRAPGLESSGSPDRSAEV